MATKNITIIIEKASDGGFSCYMEEELEHFGLSGYGDTVEEAKADLLESYQEMKEMEAEEGREVPEFNFTWKYDIQSFFNYFSFLNITKVAELAEMNASLLRQYSRGLATASEKQYEKLKKAIEKIKMDLAQATF